MESIDLRKLPIGTKLRFKRWPSYDGDTGVRYIKADGIYDERGMLQSKFGHVAAEAYEVVSPPQPAAPRPGDWLASLTSAERKECAVSRGFFAYFPDAIALVARHSVRMNEKHNPGQPVHWARGKSTDQPDCEARHLIATAVDPDVKDADGAYEMVCKAWRAFADLQEWTERKHARGEKI